MRNVYLLYLTSLLCLFTAFDVSANDYRESISDSIVVAQSETIYTAVEESPKFPGGDTAMYEWLSKNIQYPENAAKNKVQGRVTVQFVVEKDGSIGVVKVVRGKDADLDKEAIRVIKTLPKFFPGKMNGQAVRVWYTLPINFKLKNDSK